MPRQRPQPLWSPSVERVRHCHMAKFAARYAQIDSGNYAALHQWSIDDLARFWGNVWEYTSIIGDRGSHPWVHEKERIQDCQWFPDAKLNYAQNLLRTASDDPAIIFRSENLDRRIVSYKQLQQLVAKCSYFLQQQGVQPGDSVAGFLPNTIETVVAMLASASIGAVWSSCSPDFGVQGALDRLSQVAPKVLFATNGYTWKGKPISVIAKVEAIAQRIRQDHGSVTFVEFPYLDQENMQMTIDGVVSWSQVLENSAQIPYYAQLGCNHPLVTVFSSGTTGLPKCIMHRAGGVLLQHLKEHQLHADIHRGDKVFFYTTCGWMMWNWLVSVLASGATIVLYEGSPFYPHPGYLLELAEEEGINFFGTSAKYIQALEKAGVEGKNYQLDSMRTIGSTGSPLLPESYTYIHKQLSANIHIASMSGGTDLLSCFVLGNPCLPVYKGEIQCAGLGLHVDVVDGNNRSCLAGKGELVCRNPFPTMPIAFGNDPNGEKLHKAYYRARSGMWSHSDYAEQIFHTKQVSFVIHGRMDSTLNPGGIRIGTAEIYRQVEQFDDIIESVVVGKMEHNQDIQLVLCVVMMHGKSLTSKRITQIQKTIGENTTLRHVPKYIFAVTDIPKTHNGKIAELAVRDTIEGKPITNVQALINPESLLQYSQLPFSQV